jgi:hypothetical protein
MENQLTVLEQTPEKGSFNSSANFEHAQRVAKMLSSSSLVPKEFQNNVQNTMIALEMANRIGASPLMVMQNLYIVHGKPSWSSTFIIAAINSSGKFSPLRFEISGEGDQKGCIAWAYEKETKERLESPRVTMEMAKKEGWVDKNGSKWKTMPELMMRYRAAAFFGRLYAPEIMMGMHSFEEAVEIKEPIKIDKEDERIRLMIQDCKTISQLEELGSEIFLTAEQVEVFNQKKEELENVK